MRSRLKTLLLALMALCAVSAVATATASAELPEWTPVPNNFFIEGGETKLEISGTSSISSVQCKSIPHQEIEAYNFTTFRGKIRLTGCADQKGFVCTTVGASSGEIVTPELAMRLVYLSKAAKEAGLVFNYHTEPTEVTTFASFNCALTPVKARGSVIAKVTPVNEYTFVYTLTLKAAGGKQEFTKYELWNGTKGTAALEAEVSSGGWKSATLNAENLKLRTTKEGQIIA